MSIPSPSFEAISSLRALPPPLFQRLLHAHGAALAGSGLDPNLLTDASQLWEARNQLPSSFIDIVHRLHDMSDAAGHDQLLGTANGPLFLAESNVLSPFALATQTYLERPEVFHRAHGRRYVESLRRFREFPGRTPTAISVCPIRLSSLEANFGATFELRRRTRHCRIRTWTEPDSHHFLVSHGSVHRTDETIEAREGHLHESMIEWRPQQHDLVVYDLRTGRLRISAPDAQTTQLYLEGFGETLFDDATWFGQGTIVSLEPLVHARGNALLPTRGLLAVRLAELTMASKVDSSQSVTFKGDSIFSVLEDLRIDPAQWGPLRTAKFKFLGHYDHRWRTVTVAVPDRLTGDWRRWGSDIRGFLEERGFVSGPPREPLCRAA